MMKKGRRTILLVDDDRNILKSLERLLRGENYRVLTAGSGEVALEILEKEKVHLLLSDQQMPGMKGTELMAVVREGYPEVIRIILAEMTEAGTIIDSVKKGDIFKFWLKPWDEETLKLEIQQALDQYDFQETSRELHRKVLEQNEKLKKLNKDLENLVERRGTDIVFQNWALELSRTILDELPIAIIGVSAEGIITLINQEAQKISFGQRMVTIGEEVKDSFPQPIREMISTALESEKSQKLSRYPLNGVTYDLQVTPLSGSFRKRGVILTFKDPTPF